MGTWVQLLKMERRIMEQEPTAWVSTVIVRHENGDETEVISRSEHPPIDEPSSPRPPESQRYSVRECVGRGGMASVWRAFDREMSREVAIKIAHPHKDSEIAGEGRVIAGLQHPNIIPVYDISTTEDGRQFYVMKLLTGRSLDDLCNAGELSTARRIDVLRQVCLATHYAHQRGVIHRDIKPSNIIVGELGEVFLADWGIARKLSDTPEEGGPAS